MAFQTYEFVFCFLPLTLLLWYGAGKYLGSVAQRLVLLMASLAFYGSPLGLFVVAGETLLTYLIGHRLLLTRSRLLYAVSSLLLILALLVCKETMSPLGISYLTFQQILFLRAAYKGELSSVSPLSYLLYLVCFCTVSSGPITTYCEMSCQWETPVPFRTEQLAAGLWCFILGLSKKLLLADTFAKGVAFGYADPQSLTTLPALFCILSYTFQLYFDFSGYCDMAAGIAKMLGLSLPVNFNQPYRSVSVGDFWKRWHITLSRFFREVVYIPLGGNRRGLLITCRNILVIYLLSGLWHGFGMGFLLWGLLHGLAMCLERCLKGKVSLPPVLGFFLTFSFVNITWVFFSAPSLTAALSLLTGLFRFSAALPGAAFTDSLLPSLLLPFLDALNHVAPSVGHMLQRLLPLLLYPAALAMTLLVKNPLHQMEDFRPTAKKALLGSILLTASILSMGGVATFLYVDF